MTIWKTFNLKIYFWFEKKIPNFFPFEKEKFKIAAECNWTCLNKQVKTAVLKKYILNCLGLLNFKKLYYDFADDFTLLVNKGKTTGNNWQQHSVQKLLLPAPCVRLKADFTLVGMKKQTSKETFLLPSRGNN